MQFKTGLRKLFTRKETNTGLSLSTSPLPEVIKSKQSCLIYSDISKLPLSRFIDCSVDGDISALIIEGEPSQDELQAAWAQILEQYSEAVGDNEQKAMLSLFKEINRLQVNIDQVYLLVGAMKSYYVKLFAKELNKILNTSLSFDPQNQEAYENALKRCLSRCKAWELQKELKMSQYLALQKKFDGLASKQSREYYSDILIALSNSAGYEISEEISVYKFCKRLKQLKKSMEAKK
jgi:hypothetical protein